MSRFIYILFFIVQSSLAISQKHHIYSSDQFEVIKIKSASESDEVYSIEEDGDGFLWIGEQSGLFRFDGDRSTKVDLPNDLGRHMRQLKRINSELMLLGTTKGLGILNTRSFTIETKLFESEDGRFTLEDNVIRWIVPGYDSTFWVFTRTAIHLLDQRFEKIGSYRFPLDPNIVDANPTRPTAFAISGHEIVIESFRNSLSNSTDWILINLKDTSIHPVAIPELEDLEVRSCFHLGPGHIIFVGNLANQNSQAFYSLDGINRSMHKIMDYDPSDEVQRDATPLIQAAQDGITLMRLKTGYFYDFESGKIVEEYRNFRAYSRYLKMRDGTVYAANAHGLFRLTSNDVSFEKDQLFDGLSIEKPIYNVMDFVKDGNDLYIATHGYHLFKYDGKQIKQIHLSLEDRGKSLIWNVRKHDFHPSFWVGTQSGLLLYDASSGRFNQWSHKDLPREIHERPITSQFTDSEGQVWMGIGFGNGLVRYDYSNDSVHHYLYDKNQFPLRSVLAIAEDKDSNLWMGYSTGGGLVRWHRDANTFEKVAIGSESGLTTDRIRSLLMDHNNDLWVGTRYGLFKYLIQDNQFQIYTIQDGLVGEHINRLYKDKNGRIWIGTNQGLSIFDINSNRFLNLDIDQGIPGKSIESIKPWDDSGQVVFIGATEGFALIDVDQIDFEEGGGTVYIEPLVINGELSSKDVSQSINLTHRQNNIEIKYGVIGHREGGKSKYYYRINNSDWLELTRKGELQLTGLGYGSYDIDLKVCMYGTQCYEKYLEVHITPPFWHTWWFRILVLLTMIGLTSLYYHLRIQHVKKMEKMRRQISSDLHDDVGASISSVQILTDFLSKEQVKDRPAIIASIKEQSSHISEVLEEIVWNVNPKNDKIEQVIHRMQKYANDILDKRDIQIRWQIDLIQPERMLMADRRKNLYLLFKEIVNNIAKHSRAKKVSMYIQQAGNKIDLSVVDDGIGFEVNKEFTSNGIHSIRQRVQELGGDLEINSVPGKGSSIKLSMTF